MIRTKDLNVTVWGNISCDVRYSIQNAEELDQKLDAHFWTRIWNPLAGVTEWGVW